MTLQNYTKNQIETLPVVNGFRLFVKNNQLFQLSLLPHGICSQIPLNLDMQFSLVKIAVRIGLVTAAAIAVYELSNLLLIYHYFSYQFYIAGVGIIALLTGIALANRYHKGKQAVTLEEPGRVELLTAKELKILELIGQGKSNKQIAAINFVEVSTVKTHTNNIYAKLSVKNRKEAAKAFQQHNLSSKSTLSPPAVI